MADGDEDKLSRELAISASLEENGVKLKAKSRAMAALDGLVGALADVPTAFLEGIAGKKRLKDAIEAQLRQAQAAAAEEQIRGRSELGGALIDAVLVDRAKKMKNAASVAIEAVEAMKALPPPDPSQSEPVDAPDQLDPDWTAQYYRHAEEASSEQLQQLFGRILAGEVQRVGTYSRNTLRFIAELDGQTAKDCEWLARFAIRNYLPFSEEWNKGAALETCLNLQRLGLIQGVGSLTGTHSWTAPDKGQITILQGTKILVINADPGTAVNIPVFFVTRAGREVLSLLPPPTDGDGLRLIAAAVPQIAEVKQIRFGGFIRRGDLIDLVSVEVLRSAPPETP